MVLGNPLLVWGKLTKPRNRSMLYTRPKTGGTQKAKRLSQTLVKDWVKVTQKQSGLTSLLLGPHLKRQTGNPMLSY